MLGNLRPVALAEAVGLAEGHSTDCSHSEATAVGRCMDSVVVVVVVVGAAVAVKGEEVVEAGHEREGS